MKAFMVKKLIFQDIIQNYYDFFRVYSEKVIKKIKNTCFLWNRYLVNSFLITFEKKNGNKRYLS